MTTPTFPSTPGFTSVNFKINTPMLKTQSFSGKTTRVAMGHQFYSWQIKYPQMTQVDFGIINGFMGFLLGGYGAFQIVLPNISYPKAQDTPTGTVTSTSTATSGAFSVSVNGIGATRTVLRVGDFFKFNNHSKVYMATSDLTSNSGGAGTLQFAGALVKDVPSGTALTITAVPFTAILDNDAQSYEVGFGGVTSLSLDMREVW
jgi:hypothetical protein